VAGDADEFGGAVEAEGYHIVADAAGGVNEAFGDAFEAGRVFSAGAAVSDKGFSAGKAHLAAVAVAGKDKVTAGGDEGFGHFRIVRKGDSEKGRVELDEGLGDVGGGTAVALDAEQVEALTVGQFYLYGLVV